MDQVRPGNVLSTACLHKTGVTKRQLNPLTVLHRKPEWKEKKEKEEERGKKERKKGRE